MASERPKAWWWATYTLALIVLFFFGAAAGVLLGVNPYVSASVVMIGGVLRATWQEAKRDHAAK